MSYFFRKMDFLGRQIGFEYENRNIYSTIIGAVFSIITFSVATIIAFTFGKEIFQKKNPNIIISNDYLEESAVYLQDFPIMFGFFLEDNSILQNITNYFDIYFMTQIVANNGSLYYIKNEAAFCSDIINKFSQNSQEFIENRILFNPNYICLNHSKEDALEFKNTGIKSNILNYRFAFCNNQERPDCLYEGPQTFNQKNLILSFSSMTSYEDPLSYSNPVKTDLHNVLHIINKGSIKISTIEYSINTFITDKGWLFEDLSLEKYVKINKSFYDISTLTTKEIDYFYIALISLSRLGQKYSRSYMKIQVLFAKVGGIANALLLFIQATTYYYLRFDYLRFIKSKSFDIKAKKNKIIEFLNSDKIVSQQNKNNDENLNNNYLSTHKHLLNENVEGDTKLNKNIKVKKLNDNQCFF